MEAFSQPPPTEDTFWGPSCWTLEAGQVERMTISLESCFRSSHSPHHTPHLSGWRASSSLRLLWTHRGLQRNPNTILALSYTHRLLFALGLLCHVKCNWPKNNLIFFPWILRNPQSTKICHRSSNVCSPFGENPGFPYVSPTAVNCQAFYPPLWSSRLFTFKLPGLEMHLT